MYVHRGASRVTFRAVDLVERTEAVAADLPVVGRPVRLRRHGPVAVADLPQQVDALVVGKQLQIRGRLVECEPLQRAAVGRLDRPPFGQRAARGPQRPQKGHQRAHVRVRDREAGHARGGQPVAHQRRQRLVVAREEARHDAGPVLAAVAVSAVAARAEKLVLAAAGIRGLREGRAGGKQSAEHSGGDLHGRGTYHGGRQTLSKILSSNGAGLWRGRCGTPSNRPSLGGLEFLVSGLPENESVLPGEVLEGHQLLFGEMTVVVVDLQERRLARAAGGLHGGDELPRLPG